MTHVFVAAAACITTTGSYEDLETDVATTIVTVRDRLEQAEAELLAWARSSAADCTEVRLSITEADPSTGRVIGTMTYEAVPTTELRRTAP